MNESQVRIKAHQRRRSASRERETERIHMKRETCNCCYMPSVGNMQPLVCVSWACYNGAAGLTDRIDKALLF